MDNFCHWPLEGGLDIKAYSFGKEAVALELASIQDREGPQPMKAFKNLTKYPAYVRPNPPTPQIS